jgi:phospholipid/cholesterol/gamma-HCH transport system substrate-binding protein
MPVTNSQKIKTGIFTIVGIVILIAAIFIIGNNKNMFGNTFNVYGTFKSVGGLQIGNNIQFAGIKVGTIENISFVSDTIIRVDMRMDGDVKPFLKKDAIATVGASGLMGDKIITIAPGSDLQKGLLKDGDRIATVNPVGFEEIITKFTAVADNAGVITSELANMAIQIREGNGTISKLLYTDDLSNSLEATSKNAEKITASIAGITAKINAGEGSLGSLVNTNALSTKIDGVMITTDSAVGSIQDAAEGFSENMKAMQSSFLFRGYFKRKAKEEAQQADSLKTGTNTDSDDLDLNEEELEELLKDTQKALDAKRKKIKL